ncbi:hypothetical protein [Dactylosporangium sp. NPDC051484]|uniref:hypothetical protein n=1 Tax=Dactylosporangium sp. NPDC051484 TaxID=3154942 RepID=UPI003450D680
MTLVLKLLLAPMLVVASSAAGRRWGPQVSGVLVALPIVAGPILLITCLDHGPAFGARAAASALLGLVSLLLFVVVFGHAGRRLRWPAALVVSWAACLAADAALARLAVPPLAGAALVLAAAWLAARALPRDETPTPRHDAGTVRTAAAALPPAPARANPWWDLPARAVATAVLVLVVTWASAAIGPAATGVLAPFPIATSVVAAFALARDGSAGAVRMLRGVPGGLVGFAVFCLMVALLVERLGTYGAFGLALLVTLIAQLATLYAIARYRPAPA